MCKILTRFLIVTGALVITLFPAFGQTPQTAAQRFPQSIVLNGQSAQGVLVVQNGSIQAYTCASPQPYTTPDQASSGWACFDQTSGQWLLHALPPQSQNANQAVQAPLPAPPASQPQVVYGAPLPGYAPPAVVPAYGYYPYDYYAGYYPYGYYPYGYYPYFGASFGFGFGYGYGYGGYRGAVIGGRAFGGVSTVRAGGRVGGGRR